MAIFTNHLLLGGSKLVRNHISIGGGRPVKCGFGAGGGMIQYLTFYSIGTQDCSSLQ